MKYIAVLLTLLTVIALVLGAVEANMTVKAVKAAEEYHQNVPLMMNQGCPPPSFVFQGKCTLLTDPPAP